MQIERGRKKNEYHEIGSVTSKANGNAGGYRLASGDNIGLPK